MLGLKRTRQTLPSLPHKHCRKYRFSKSHAINLFAVSCQGIPPALPEEPLGDVSEPCEAGLLSISRMSSSRTV